MQIEDGDEGAREGGSEADQDDIQSDIERAGRTGSTSFAVGNGVESINPMFANGIEEKRKEKRKKLGKLGRMSKMVSSRHLGGVKKIPTAGAARGGGSEAASRRDDTAGTAGGDGDNGISEGIESKRPDLMTALDDDRLNRTGSMEIDGGGGDSGDGGNGGDVNEGAETKGEDLTIALDDDDRREERN
jgi:hypothetical protein